MDAVSALQQYAFLRAATNSGYVGDGRAYNKSTGTRKHQYRNSRINISCEYEYRRSYCYNRRGIVFCKLVYEPFNWGFCVLCLFNKGNYFGECSILPYLCCTHLYCAAVQDSSCIDCVANGFMPGNRLTRDAGFRCIAIAFYHNAVWCYFAASLNQQNVPNLNLVSVYLFRFKGIFRAVLKNAPCRSRSHFSQRPDGRTRLFHGFLSQERAELEQKRDYCGFVEFANHACTYCRNRDKQLYADRFEAECLNSPKQYRYAGQHERRNETHISNDFNTKYMRKRCCQSNEYSRAPQKRY